MSVGWVIRKSLQKTKCDIHGHSVRLEDERKLFASNIGEVTACCERCDAPLRLVRVSHDTYRVRESI